MAQDATAAPAPTLANAAASGESLATTSAAATNAASHTAPAAAEDKPLDKVSADEHKAAVLANLGDWKAKGEQEQARKSGKGKAPPAAGEAPPEATVEAATETAAETVAATVETPLAAAPPAEEDPAAAALLKLARDGQRLSKERKQFREEQARQKAEGEREATTRAAERDRIAKLETARTGGSPLAVLRAAGLTDEQIQGPFVVDLLNQMKAEEEARTGQANPGLTREQVIQLVQAQQAEQLRLAAEQGETERQRQQRALQASIERDRNAFFGQVKTEFKTGQYPLVAAVRPIQGELDAHFVSHFQSTGERLTASQLLAAFEKRYKDEGLIVVPKPRPGAKPTKPAPAAISRTISSRAQEDVGDTHITTENKTPRSMDDIRSEGRQKAIDDWNAKQAARAATGGGRRR